MSDDATTTAAAPAQPTPEAPAASAAGSSAAAPRGGVRAIVARAVSWVDLNAMMYKELTQGVRSRGFLALFYLLLIWALVLIVIVPFLSESGDESGLYTFGMLAVSLHIYGIIVGSRSMSMTVKEVENKTFELYAVAGMSPEKMVLGKYLTSAYIFFFGLCCLAPFMFASYYMRGLDFSLIWQTLATIAVVHLLFFMLATVAGLFRVLTRSRALMAGLYSIFSIGALFIGISMISVGTFSAARGGMTGPMTLWTHLDWSEFAFLAAWYFGLLLTLFYWACQLVCPDTDSREHLLKFLLVALYLILLAMSQMGVGPSSSPEYEPYEAWALFLGFGLIFWISREDVPIIVRNRIGRAGLVRRLAMMLFEPGRRGTARCMIVAAVTHWLIVMTAWKYYGTSMTLHQSVLLAGLPLLALFQMTSADYLARSLRPLAENPPLRRATVFFFWGILAMVHVFIMYFVLDDRGGIDGNPITTILGIALTPFLTPYAVDAIVAEGEATFRAALLTGLAGVSALALLARDFQRLRAEDRVRVSMIGSGVMAMGPPPPVRQPIPRSVMAGDTPPQGVPIAGVADAPAAE